VRVASTDRQTQSPDEGLRQRNRLIRLPFIRGCDMSLRERIARNLGIIDPCLPTPAKRPPSGPGWLHEIKHDGIRLLARKDFSTGVHLITRHGTDFIRRYPSIEMAVKGLPGRSFLIDGEAVVCDVNGVAVFELIRGQDTIANAAYFAFD